ncbi:Cytochrome b/c1 [bacterium HR40]|nr:Cytochrome b/c1 [bacterium HR40]
MRKALLATALLLVPLAASAAEGEALVDRSWPHEGFFGSYDKAALQRGFQVFEQVCASCHSAKYLAFRHLAGIGLDEAQIAAIAARYTVVDGPDDKGEMFERPARPSDYFPRPFPNEQAARAANNGALPPDLSLIVKAREGHEDYIYSLLVGFEEPPADVEVPSGQYYNRYFPGHLISMPPPLSEGMVEYADGTPATVPQMAEDVTQFLAWLSEPHLETRKAVGLKFMLFVLALTGIFYAYKRRLWAKLH